MTQQLSIVYSCSGCSSAAQMANHLALQLDRSGIAEMSCIAGVGGDVPSLVSVARSGRPLVVLDGCALACARHCLARHGIEPSLHFTLSEHGVKKRKHQDFEPALANVVLERLSHDVRDLRRDVSQGDSRHCQKPDSVLSVSACSDDDAIRASPVAR
jgi:uncharacterized metal-binding protein